jgi:hypothetical protein
MIEIKHYIIGIDPGTSGAIAVIAPSSGLIEIHDCPTRSVRGSNGKPKDILDFSGVASLLRSYRGNAIAVIEKVSAGLFRVDGDKQGEGKRTAIGAVSASTFMQNFGAWQQACACNDIPTRLVTPSVWKRTVGLSKDKARSIRVAAELFPRADISDSHDRAEALMLAYYGWLADADAFLTPPPKL